MLLVLLVLVLVLLVLLVVLVLVVLVLVLVLVQPRHKLLVLHRLIAKKPRTAHRLRLVFAQGS